MSETTTDARRHTPGPWRYTEHRSVRAPDGHDICEVFDVLDLIEGRAQGPDPKRDANGRLMAAAPDLLAELREAAGWLDVRAADLDVLANGPLRTHPAARQLRDLAATLRGRAAVLRRAIADAESGAA